MSVTFHLGNTTIETDERLKEQYSPVISEVTLVIQVISEKNPLNEIAEFVEKVRKECEASSN